MNVVCDAVEQGAGEALAGEDRSPFLEGLGMTMGYLYKPMVYIPALSNLSSRLDNSVRGMALSFARPDAPNFVRLAAAV